MLSENWAPTTYNCAIDRVVFFVFGEIKRAVKEHCEGICM